MSARISLRRRLLLISGLGLLLFAFAFGALVLMRVQLEARLLQRAEQEALVEAQRRAREALGAGPEVHFQDEEVCRSGHVWSGVQETPEQWPERLPPAAASALSRLQESGLESASDAELRTVSASVRLTDGRTAWAWIAVEPPAGLRRWRVAAGALVLVMALQFGLSVSTMTRVRRDARGLEQDLLALGEDLSVPVRQPRVRVMSEIALGVQQLAERLRSQRERQRSLQRQLEQTQRLASLGRVATGVAHEVRNPLAGIRLQMDLAAMVHPEAGPELEEARAEIDRLDRLVNALLGFARPGPESALEPLDVLARRRVAWHQGAAEAAGRLLSVEGECCAEVASDAISQVLDNLLRNALQASDAAVWVVLGRDQHGAVLRVEDDGPGVHPDDLSRLFEPFFTTRPDGTGLGLSLSWALVRSLDGDLRYTREGDRTVFTLSLPEATCRPS